MQGPRANGPLENEGVENTDRSLKDEEGTRPWQAQEAQFRVRFSPLRITEKPLNRLHFTEEGGQGGGSELMLRVTP